MMMGSAVEYRKNPWLRSEGQVLLTVWVTMDKPPALQPLRDSGGKPTERSPKPRSL